MGKVIAFLAIVVSTSALAFLYYELQMTPLSTEPSVYVSTLADRSIKTVHAFKDGIHRYNGSFRLPHSCFEVSKGISIDPLDPNRTSILLQFRTKDVSAQATSCAQYTTPYPFELLIESEEGAEVRAEIDGKAIPLQITESTWMNPKGTTVTAPK